MKLTLTAEQRQFGAAIHELLANAGVPAAARAWADGEPGPGLAIWQALAKAGVTALAVPESAGGLGATPVDLAVACEELGHHPVPGPIAESIAAVPRLLTGTDADRWLPGLAAGELIGTLALPPVLPYALDADVAGLVLLAGPRPANDSVASPRLLAQPQGGNAVAEPDGVGGCAVWLATPTAPVRSMDPARRLFELRAGQEIATGPDAVRAATGYGTLASAALLLGAGRGLLEASAQHARTREQFGRPIGAFQAVQHSLANVLIGLEFARPLLYAAAITLGTGGPAGGPTAGRDLSAARVACADAARLAARTALQVHGAIGYTRECDISLWLAKVRALSSTWGSQAEHRAVVLAALTEPGTGPWN